MAENKDNNITSVMEALIKGAETVFTTKTVVGEATKVDDTIIIPLVDVSFGSRIVRVWFIIARSMV